MRRIYQKQYTSEPKNKKKQRPILAPHIQKDEHRQTKRKNVRYSSHTLRTVKKCQANRENQLRKTLHMLLGKVSPFQSRNLLLGRL